MKMTMMLKVGPIWKKNQWEKTLILLYSQLWMVLADTDNEALIEVLIGDHIAENEDRDGNEHADEVENQLPIEQPKKQKFKNLDQVLDEDKYCDLLAQRKRF